MEPPGGLAPVDVTFSVDEECVPEGIASVTWDLGDGSEPVVAPTHTASYLSGGGWTITATVEDATGATASGTSRLVVGSQVCPTLGDVEEWGEVGSDDVVEASGLVHSLANPGVLWTHNDSGSAPEIFAMAEDGTPLGTWDLDVSMRDFEDIATGWNEELNTWALYAGDVGDNGVSRDDITVLIVPEPVVAPDQEEVEETLADVGKMKLTYPDGPHNCESILIDPITNVLLVITKDSGGDTAVFKKEGPHTADWEGELEWVADLDLSESPFSGSRSTTAADIHPDGYMIALRTYSDVWLFLRDPTEDFAATFARDPCDGEAPSESQGEAISFSADGQGYVVVSEGGHQPIQYRPIVPVPE
jgi:hypothetical protein